MKATIRSLAATLGLLVAALLLPAWAHAAASVTNISLVSSTRVGRTTFDYTYTIAVQNGTPALNQAQATVTSSSAATQVIKGAVSLGTLAAGATTASSDTFTIRQDRTVPFNPAALTWTVTGTPVGGPPSMSVTLSDAFVAPNGSITVVPVVKDGNGVVQSNAGLQFNVSVSAAGPVTGNAPVINGLTVSFPKLVKRLISPNPTIDPNGLYADTDPADPNYGKETGGRYHVNVSLVGSSLTASEDVTVLPAGTANVSYTAGQYAGQMGNAMALALQASQSGDPNQMSQAKAAFTAVNGNSDFSFTVLNATNASAPPDGYLVTPSILQARGFTPGNQDAQYAAALADLVTKIRLVKAQIAAINVASPDPNAITALQNGAAAYKQSLQALHALQTSTLGASQQQGAINQQLATEIPQLMDAIKVMGGSMLGIPVVAPAPAAARAKTAAIASSEWFASLASGQSASVTTMYAGVEPVQFSFFSTMFGILTDLSGTARGNIIELVITLTNSLVNIAAANVINQNNPGGMSLDYCLASSSLAFACPNYMPTRIGGSGFGRDASVMKVALVGCIGGDLIRNLMTLRNPTNLAAGIRLINKVISISNSLQQQGGVGAVVVPDYIADDEIGLANDMLYFSKGWPRVNQGRLPCVGIVIVMNTQTGGLVAVNLDFLGQCG